MKYFKQALSVLREVGDQGREASTLYNIGVLYYKNLRFDIALACFLVAKRICEETRSSICEENQKTIDNLREEVGRQQYNLLLEKVGPQAPQILERAMQEGFLQKGL